MIRKVLIFCLLTTLFGCAGLEVKSDYEIGDVINYPEPEQQGIYHKVNPGETIWRIAKAYEVSISDIIQSNKIPDVAKIEDNQLIFIPGAIKEIVIQDETIDIDENKEAFIWPVDGKVVSYFRESINSRINKGIDIRVMPGDPVVASRAGEVVFADDLPGYGKTVIIDHGDGFYSVYSLNTKLLVDVGEHVRKRTMIAHVGTTGDTAKLHFEIRKNNLEDNPLYYLP